MIDGKKRRVNLKDARRASVLLAQVAHEKAVQYRLILCKKCQHTMFLKPSVFNSAVHVSLFLGTVVRKGFIEPPEGKGLKVQEKHKVGMLQRQKKAVLHQSFHGLSQSSGSYSNTGVFVAPSSNRRNRVRIVQTVRTADRILTVAQTLTMSAKSLQFRRWSKLSRNELIQERFMESKEGRASSLIP